MQPSWQQRQPEEEVNADQAKRWYSHGSSGRSSQSCRRTSVTRNNSGWVADFVLAAVHASARFSVPLRLALNHLASFVFAAVHSLFFKWVFSYIMSSFVLYFLFVISVTHAHFLHSTSPHYTADMFPFTCTYGMTSNSPDTVDNVSESAAPSLS